MTDDALKRLEQLRERIASEGLPPLSADALRASRLDRWPLSRPGRTETVLTLSEEARRLFLQKRDPRWFWRKR